MQIIRENKQRMLIQKDGKKVNVHNGSYLQYTGIHYTPVSSLDVKTDIYWYDDIPLLDLRENERKFVGIVESYRYRCDVGIQGIYIRPLYIWNEDTLEWNKIVNYKKPKNKYFLYPHLLMLPGHGYYNMPLYSLHTCKNVDIHRFAEIEEPFYL